MYSQRGFNNTIEMTQRLGQRIDAYVAHEGITHAFIKDGTSVLEKLAIQTTYYNHSTLLFSCVNANPVIA